MSEHELHIKALKKVKSIRRLYIHMSLYVVMAGFFFLLNIVTDPFDMWWFFPILPWSVIISMHYIFVKGIPGTNILSKDWEEEEYEKQYEKLEAQHFLPEQKYLKTGEHLAYTELSIAEVLELRKMQQSGEKLGNEGFV